MGILSGRPVESYVLRVQDDKLKIGVSIKPTGNSEKHQTATVNPSGNTSSKPPTHPHLQRHTSSHAAVMISTGAPDLGGAPAGNAGAKENYNYGQNRQASARLQKQGSELVVAAGPSAKASGLSKKDPSSKVLTRQTTQPLVHQASFAVSPSVKVGSTNGPLQLQCASEFPWLIKQANMSLMQLQDFDAGRIIGKGLMGTVRITKLKSSDRFFALKSIRKEYILRHNDLRHVQNEKQALQALHHHPFIVNLFGTFQDRVHVFFALQYVPGGELYRRLTKVKRFTPQVAKFYVTEVCSALSHIQRQGFVYRDLKPENVMIDEEGHCKLVDFGFAIKCGGRQSAGTDEKMHTLCGTPAYLSPEQLDGKLTNGYTRVVDWWSFGVLIFELLTGKTPFCKHNTESHYEIFLRILNHKISFPMGFDVLAKEIVSQLCHPTLQKRLVDVDDIQRHHYFEIPWASVEARQLVPPYVPRLSSKDEGKQKQEALRDRIVRYFDMYHDPHNTPHNSTEHDKQPGAAKQAAAQEAGYEYLDF